jgi:hypothetical protein
VLVPLRGSMTESRPTHKSALTCIDSGGAKGTRTPHLTRQNAGLTAVSVRLVPIGSRSLPAVSFSGLDGVKSEIKAGVPGTPERRIGLAAIALLSSTVKRRGAPSRGCGWCSPFAVRIW